MAAILVVDDEPDVAESIRAVLEHSGFEVVVANSAAAGLEAVETQEFAVVVTDIIMPKVNGLELIRNLRRNHPGLQIIAISGGGSFGPLSHKPDAISTHAFIAAARDAGAVVVLTKPFDMDDLLAAIRRHLPN
jgi:two-component system copper resistance phosphate regulon response regulator CusR